MDRDCENHQYASPPLSPITMATERVRLRQVQQQQYGLVQVQQQTLTFSEIILPLFLTALLGGIGVTCVVVSFLTFSEGNTRVSCVLSSVTVQNPYEHDDDHSHGDLVLAENCVSVGRLNPQSVFFWQNEWISNVLVGKPWTGISSGLTACLDGNRRPSNGFDCFDIFIPEKFIVSSNTPTWQYITLGIGVPLTILFAMTLVVNIVLLVRLKM